MKKVHLPKNVRLFIPLHQQAVVSDPDYFREYKEVIDRLDMEIEEIPREEQFFTEGQISEKGSLYDCLMVYAHFFYGGCDWFILDWNREQGILFCYAILNGDTQMSELGSTFLSDLRGDGRIELDFHWSRCSLAEALYDKYPGDFPEPHYKTEEESQTFSLDELNGLWEKGKVARYDLPGFLQDVNDNTIIERQ